MLQKIDGISLSIFKYYNKTENFISSKELIRIEKELETKHHLFYTTDEYSKNGIIFCFYKKYEAEDEKKEKIPTNMVGIFNKSYEVDTKIVNGLFDVYNNFFFNFELTIYQENIIKQVGCNNFDENKYIVFNTWKEYDVYICSTIKQKTLPSYKFESFNTFYNFKPLIYTTTGEESYYDKVFIIEDVKEFNTNNVNYRMYLYRQLARTGREEDYIVSTIDEKNPIYNYIDKGRVFFFKNDKKIYYSSLYKDNGNIDISVFNLISKNIKDIIGSDSIVFNEQIYRFYNNLVKREDMNGRKLTLEEKKICEKYLLLLDNNKDIKIKHIILNKKEIKTEDGMFSVKFDDNFLSVANNFIDIKEAINESTNHFDFNVLYEKLINLSCLRKINYTTQYHSNGLIDCKITINGMDILIKSDGSRYYINDIFTRIADLTSMLKKAICYNNVEEYNKYVKDVSYIGLELKTLINNGIVIHLEAPFEQNLILKMKNKRIDNLIMRFSLLWDAEKRSKIYLVLNGAKYAIKNKTSFKKEFLFPEKHIHVDDLQEKLATCLEDYEEDKFFEIIDNAVKENIIIKKRGEDLLNQTIIGTKAKREEITINGTLMKGYRILGIKTNSDYFIEEINLNVYKLVNGFWSRRCVISDGNKQRIWEDKVANRLINIYNENSRIYTLFN